MFFETNNTSRVHVSFKADTGSIPLEHANKNFIDRVREKNTNFEFETSYVNKRIVNYKIKGTSNVNILIGCLKIFPGNIHSLNRKEIEDKSFFFFDIKIDNDVLKNTLQSKTDGTREFVRNILCHYLQTNNFFDSCSGFTYLKKCMCVRLFYKNEIDFNYASLEFAKYSKGSNDFSYPELKSVDVEDQLIRSCNQTETVIPPKQCNLDRKERKFIMKVFTAKEVMPAKRKIKEGKPPRKRRKKEKVIDIPFLESPKEDQYQNLTEKMESNKHNIVTRYSDETFKNMLDEILKSLVTD